MKNGMTLRLTLVGLVVGFADVSGVSGVSNDARAEIRLGANWGLYPSQVQEGEASDPTKGTKLSLGRSSMRFDASYVLHLKEVGFPLGVSFVQTSSSGRETRFNTGAVNEESWDISAFGLRGGAEWRGILAELAYYFGPSSSFTETGKDEITYKAGSGIEFGIGYSVRLLQGLSLTPRFIRRAFSWDERTVAGATTEFATRPQTFGETIFMLGLTYDLPIKI